MSWEFQIGTEIFSEEQFQGQGHVVHFPRLIGALLQAFQGGWSAATGDSLTIATGPQAFTAEAGLFWVPGMSLQLISKAEPDHYMLGTIDAYDSETGATQMTAEAIVGAGRVYSSWDCVATHWEVRTINPPLSPDQGGTGAGSIEGALASFGLRRTWAVRAVLSSPPAAHVAGDLYLVGPDRGSAGAWDKQQGNLARSTGSGWEFLPPADGDRVAILDEDAVGTGTGAARGARVYLSGYSLGQLPGWADTTTEPPRVVAAAASTTLEVEDLSLARTFVELTAAAAAVLTLTDDPAAAGRQVEAKNASGVDHTINVKAGGTIDGSASLALAAGEAATLVKAQLGAGWHITARYAP